MCEANRVSGTIRMSAPQANGNHVCQAGISLCAEEADTLTAGVHGRTPVKREGIMNTQWTAIAVAGLILFATGYASADQLFLRYGTNNYWGTTDTYMDEDNPNTNYTNETRLSVYDVGDEPNENSLIRFDLTGQLPPAIEIDEAYLGFRLNATRSLGGTGEDWADVGVYRICRYRDWGETEATWNVFKGTTWWGQGGCEREISECEPGYDRLDTPDDSIEFDGDSIVGVHYEWDVTDSLVAWCEEGMENNGWLIRVEDSEESGSEGVWLDSKRAAIEGCRPYLKITYTVVPEPTTFSLLAIGALAIRRRRRRQP